MFKRILDGAKDAICVINIREKKVVYKNEAMNHLLGKPLGCKEDVCAMCRTEVGEDCSKCFLETE